MKGRSYLLLGLLLGGLMGWGLGFLRLPYVPSSQAFWIGFFCALAGLSALLLFWNSRGKLKNSSKTTRVGVWAAVLVAGTCLAAVLFMASQRSLLKKELAKQEALTEQQAAILAAQQQANLGKSMEILLRRVEEEASAHPTRTLSPQTIKQIADFSHTFEPYPCASSDSFGPRKLSPERGQLLFSLVGMALDSVSFDQIKKTATFSYADLRGAYLAKAPLARVDLKRANLINAVLDSADLSDANLYESWLKNASCNGVNMDGIDLRRTQAQWIRMNNASIRKAILDGANLSHAVMNGVNMDSCIFQWGFMQGASLTNSMLTFIDFRRTIMISANFDGADLSRSSLLRTTIEYANLTDVIFYETSVEEPDWLEKLPEWKNIGAKEIQASYTVVQDTLVRFYDSKFLLIPKDYPFQN